MMWDQQGRMPNPFAPRLSATPPPRGNIGPPIQQFGRPVGPQPLQGQIQNQQLGRPSGIQVGQFANSPLMPKPTMAGGLTNNSPMPWQRQPMQGGMLGTPPPGMGGQVGPSPMPVQPQPMGQGQMPTQQMPMPQMGRPPGM